MHQCFQRRCPQYIFDLVSFRTGTGRLHSATTRAAVIHRPLTPLVACHIVKLCNSLPADRVDFGSLGHFRRSLHKIDFSSFLTVE